MAKDEKHRAAEDDEMPRHADEPQEIIEDRAEDEISSSEDTDGKPTKEHGKKASPFKRLWHWALTHKKISLPVAVLFLLAVLAAMPFTRYLIAGTVLKQSFSVVIVDAETGKPVSSATVRLAGKETVTDNEGRAAKIGLQPTKRD